MNELQQGILTWLKSALTGELLPLPEPLDLDAACKLVRAHQLTAMAYDGASQCGVDQQHPAMQTLFQRYVKVMQISARQLQALEKLYAAFEGQGIDCLPLKGCIMKALYPKPELRIMGDADILIRTEQYEQIVPILQTLGFRRVQESDYDYSWENDALHLELHKSLFPPQDADFTRYFGTGWDFASTREGHRHAMSAADSFVYMFAHFAKHFRDGTAELKGLCDLWLCRAAAENTVYMENQLERLQLLTFYRNVRSLLNGWFLGTPMSDAAARLTEAALCGGLRSQEEAQKAVELIRIQKETTSLSRGKKMWMLRKIFPTAQWLSMGYPILKKWPVLLPVFWVVRWCRLLFRERDKMHRNLAYMQDVESADAALADAYAQQLQELGLGFNFPT